MEGRGRRRGAERSKDRAMGREKKREGLGERGVEPGAWVEEGRSGVQWRGAREDDGEADSEGKGEGKEERRSLKYHP